MDIHKNARSCLASRGLLVRRVREQGWTVRAAAEAAGLSVRRAYHWLARERNQGPCGLRDRSSRPWHQPKATAGCKVEQVMALRRERCPAAEIAQRVGVPLSTVGRLLRRHGLGRLHSLDPRPPVLRYERSVAGELLHLDVKKLGRIVRPGHRVTGDRSRQPHNVGWEFLHVCIDDRSRAAYVEILGDERKDSATAFLQRACAWFAAQGVTVTGVMTDNGNGYRSHLFREACQAAGIRHLRTRPYCPRTNGKAERFIQTLLREWAYRFRYEHSDQRRALLEPYLHFYNFHRAHRGLGGLPPVSRLRLNNVVSTNS
jgi:transposase InsO family protein